MITVTVDVGLIQHIESALAVDCCPPPDAIAPLAERDENRFILTRQEEDALDGEIRRVMDDVWLLELWELHAIQRLRGWHRLRYGSVTVDRDALSQVCSALSNLSCGLGNECDEALRECGVDRVRIAPVGDPGAWLAPWRGQVLASMRETGYCGDCLWCQVCHLHDQCSAILDGTRTAQ